MSTRSIAHVIGNYNSARSIGSLMRRRRSVPLVQMIEKTHSERGRCLILDLGGTERYWKIFDRDFLRRTCCRITLVNVAPRPLEDPQLFDMHVGDATAVAIDDGAFDVVHSNSVLEHVGGWDQMRMFSMEVRRLAPRYFVQTPNFWFPWEPHYGFMFFHYLPRPTRVALMMRKDRGFFKRCPDLSTAVEAVDAVRLIDAKMFRCLFPDARFIRENVFGLTKSLIAVRDE
jgi:hypothetical protein